LAKGMGKWRAICMHGGSAPEGQSKKEDNKMAKKTIKRLKKSTKVESTKTLRKLGVG
jgi:hypothetical protein